MNKADITKDIFRIRPKNNLNVVDFFSGCGGLSLGFKLAGYNTLLAVDNDKDSLATIDANHCSSETLNLDLFDDHSLDKIIQKVDKEINIVIAGPPCQGFSLTGPRKLNDRRNKLYLSVIKYIQNVKPKAFLIENVRGMASLYNGRIMENIKDELASLGYIVETKILNAKYYGVPQSRERLFYVGMKDKKFKFPDPLFSDDEAITCGDAISDLPSLENTDVVDKYDLEAQSLYQNLIRANTKIIHNHVTTKHTAHVVDVIKQVPEGGNHRDLPEGVGTSRKFNEAWTRYHRNKPSRTIDTGHRNHFHYVYNRVPTVRENCRLQSFPDSFIIIGTKTSQNRQVGNAVPVLLAKILAEKINEQL